MKRIFALFLLLSLLLPLASCSSGIEAPAETIPVETEEAQTEEKSLTPEEEKILAERRDKVADYMHQMATILWRSAEDLDYTIKSDVSPNQVTNGSGLPQKLTLKKGRLYQGLPYTYASNGIASFSQAFTETDGIPDLSGLNWQMLSGGGKTARFGNDCATAVMQAWGQVGNSFAITSTAYLCANNGFLPVGSYYVSKAQLSDTKKDCKNNGEETMFASYAKLQKADAVVERNGGSGHTMMVTSVHAVPYGDSFHPEQSYITVTHQTRSYYAKDAKYYDEKLGEDVYTWYGIDDKYTFRQLYNSGYLPITCKELIDPSPLPELKISSSVTELTPENFFTGEIRSNQMIEFLAAEIKNDSDAVVQKAIVAATRKTKTEFPCNTFLDETYALGKIDLSALPQGSYTLTVTANLVNGERVPVRELSFTK